MKNRFIKGLLFFAPLALGAAGLILVDRQPVLNSLFQCVWMYTLNYQDPPPNVLVELARWTAPLATASGILLAFARLRDRLLASARCLRRDSVAVYGPAQMRAALLDRLGRRGVDGGEGREFIPAQNYLLLDDEAQNFDFYTRNRSALAGRTVYLQCSALPAQSVADAGLRLFCPEETAARLFWKQRCLYQTSARCGHRMRLVFVGFGTLGRNLLTCALQNNIFDPDQRIEYHIFGDGAEFAAVHTRLSSISDPVLFHGEPWYEDLSLLQGAQMVVVLTQEDQPALVQNLLLATTGLCIDVFAAGGRQLELLAGQERLRLFYWKQLGWEPEYIFGGALFDRAKRINLRYAHLYGGAAETDESREAEWNKLDAFTRYSNVSAADYHEVRLQMLAALGWPADADALAPEQMELLAELEHIRWCRYHDLNNWKPGVPQNGARKDPVSRLHMDLIPYSDLTEAGKQKDRDNIRVLLSVR